MPITDNDSAAIIARYTNSACDDRIDFLKQRIFESQKEIVFLTVMRQAVEARDAFQRISRKKADELIDEALRSVNSNMPSPKAKIDAEGGIVDTCT